MKKHPNHNKPMAAHRNRSRPMTQEASLSVATSTADRYRKEKPKVTLVIPPWTKPKQGAKSK